MGGEYGRLAPWSSTDGQRSLVRDGLRDLVDGLRQWRLWYLIGSSDMRRRYARSRLGQLWIMLSSAIMISTMGLVWSYLWQQPTSEMLPYVAIGMIVWQLLSGIVTEAALILPNSSHYFHNQYIPAATIIFSLIYRQLVTFALNILFPIALALFFGVSITWHALAALPGLVFLVAAATWLG
jgi:ABC-type polysaccharide/polyol phosphate export permease